MVVAAFDQYSNASRQLGMAITLLDHKQGVLKADFTASENFTNRVGNIQGGFLVAMLDDLMGYALGFTLPEDQFAPTANLNVSFLRPAKAGILRGEGRVLKNDEGVFHLSGKLYSDANELIASATARAKLGVKV